MSNASFYEGFDASIEMAENILDNYDSNELAALSVFDFIEKFRNDLSAEADLYKKDG